MGDWKLLKVWTSYLLLLLYQVYLGTSPPPYFISLQATLKLNGGHRRRQPPINDVSLFGLGLPYKVPYWSTHIASCPSPPATGHWPLHTAHRNLLPIQVCLNQACIRQKGRLILMPEPDTMSWPSGFQLPHASLAACHAPWQAQASTQQESTTGAP